MRDVEHALFWRNVERLSQKYEKNQKQEFLDKKQESSKDTREYYAEKSKLWVEAYTSENRSMVEDEMIMGLYEEELKETCSFYAVETTTGKKR